MQKQTMKILTSIIATLPFLIGSADAPTTDAATSTSTHTAITQSRLMTAPPPPRPFIAHPWVGEPRSATRPRPTLRDFPGAVNAGRGYRAKE